MIKTDNIHNFLFSTHIHSSSISSGFTTKQTPELASIFTSHTHIGVRQIHSDSIWHADSEPEKSADGIITAKTNVLLYVKTADCVPMLYADKRKKIIGVSHQGWRGTLLRLPQKMVRAFEDKGANTKDIVVAIGPAIGACCYKIYGERKSLFAGEFGSITERIFIEQKNETYLNLLYLNYLQLIECGISKKNIDFFPFCTRCDAQRFYSYQRKDMEDEMVGFICS